MKHILIANMVVIAKNDFNGVTNDQVAQAGWEEDQEIAKGLLARKVGEALLSSRHALRYVTNTCRNLVLFGSYINKLLSGARHD